MASSTIAHKLFDKLGVPITIYNTGAQSIIIRGFLQPLLYKNKLYLDGIRTEIGYDGQHTYLLITPPVYDLSLIDNSNSYLIFNDDIYVINHTEKVYLRENWHYSWSVVSKV